MTWDSTAQVYNDLYSVVHACGREPTGGVHSLERSLGGVAVQTGWRLAVVVCRHAGMGCGAECSVVASLLQVWWHRQASVVAFHTP